jgi:5'-nucleotidase
VAGLTFLDEAETVNALVPHLQKNNIEAIVVLLHEGGQSNGGSPRSSRSSTMPLTW